MHLLVRREIETANSLAGTFYVNGIRECYTLEPPLIPKISEAHPDGLSCVPFGIYQVRLRQDGTVWTWMQKSCPGIGLENGIPWIFNADGIKYPMWHETAGIRPNQYVLIHIGNFENSIQDDSLGCLLLGLSRKTDYIGQSTAAFSAFFPRLLTAMRAGEVVTIEYADGRVKA